MDAVVVLRDTPLPLHIEVEGGKVPRFAQNVILLLTHLLLSAPIYVLVILSYIYST